MLTELSSLTGLAERITRVDFPVIDHWSDVHGRFREWADRPELRTDLRQHLNTLSPNETMRIIAASRETTTHFAWCLRDEADEPFTFWLHEYKPQRDWRAGYADSVHNHRYHFCTTILSGSYLHEQYDVRLSADGCSVTSTELVGRTDCTEGAAGMLLSHEFHRIPHAADGTVTFLVKSRAVMPWSLSFDPGTATSHRHVPVEERLEELTNSL